MSHTPGPWWACPPDEDSQYWEVEDGFGHTATVYGDDSPAKFNARLIASAPELLESLVAMRVAFTSDGTDAQHKACALADRVIKQAGGDE